MRFDTRGRTLVIEGNEVEFDAELGDVIELEDAVVVQLAVPTETDRMDAQDRRRNVRCIEPDGSTRWVVQRADPSQGDYQPYTGLWKEDGAVWAYNWNGIAYELDVDDGTHLRSKQMK